MNYKTLIFDLGNVLVDFSHEKMFSQMAAVTGIPSEEVHSLLFEERTGLQYERGLITTEEIYALIKTKATLSFEMPELLDAASSIFSPKIEMERLVHKLKTIGYRLIVLSNTFKPHIDYISNNYSILPYFDYRIYSYEVGFAKPEPQIYKLALKYAECPPKEVYYIDDKIENIRPAEILGIHCHHFKSPSLLMDDLIRRGILS
ncbi:MAG: HAD family phosphatase [Chlamydiia bacterium]|nr:HAD family phosphatase [Chlamydiia bacterium]